MRHTSIARLRTGAAAITTVAVAVLAAGPGTALAAPPPGPAPAGSAPAEVLARTDAALQQNKAAVKGSEGDTYAVFRSVVDPDGSAHVRYTRRHNGLRVYGGDFVVHTAPGGAYAGVSVGLADALTLDVAPAVAAASATTTARAKFSGTVNSVGRPELFIDASSGKGRLAWETVVTGVARDGQTPSVLHVIADAASGAFIGSFDEIESVVGTGNSVYSGSVSIDTTRSGSTYSMVDPTHGGGSTCDMNNGTSTCTAITGTDNVWGNGATSDRHSVAVDAHFGAAKTFDYFLNKHGRNGIFGNGRGVPSRVHYGNAYVNAFWNGSSMTYGDGSGNVRPLVSLDVAGHEMSHGVTSAAVPGGLTYSGESGGLNEATSDIFGSMVEFDAGALADPGDYLVGEKINIRGNGAPLRYMHDPDLDGQSDSCWSTGTRNKDVHYSSGVANHFYFALAEGTGATPYGNSPTCVTMSRQAGIGRAKAEKIWFRALDVYFTSNTSYVNTSTPANTARAYTMRAATDLYGACAPEVKAVEVAWLAVNVAPTGASCFPQIPNVLGLTVAAATDRLTAAGFVRGTLTDVVDDFCRDIGRVKRQSPAAGVGQPSGTRVDLWVGKLPPRPCP